VKEKQYEVRLQAIEDGHRQSTLELREMLSAQQQMSAKYVSHSHSLLSCVFDTKVAGSTAAHCTSWNDSGQIVYTRNVLRCQAVQFSSVQ